MISRPLFLTKFQTPPSRITRPSACPPRISAAARSTRKPSSTRRTVDSLPCAVTANTSSTLRWRGGIRLSALRSTLSGAPRRTATTLPFGNRPRASRCTRTSRRRRVVSTSVSRPRASAAVSCSVSRARAVCPSLTGPAAVSSGELRSSRDRYVVGEDYVGRYDVLTLSGLLVRQRRAGHLGLRGFVLCPALLA